MPRRRRVTRITGRTSGLSRTLESLLRLREGPNVEGEATGRGALDRHLRERAPVREAWTGTPLLRWDEGGPDPLASVRCLEEAGVWRFVGYGLSELDEKASPDESQSGWGFEITLAVSRTEHDAPDWPIALLQALARHVHSAHDILAEGDQVLLSEPCGNLTHCLFTPDPLGTLATPFGRVRFVQAVGITPDELDAVRAWQSTPFLALMREHSPYLLMDPGRDSILRNDAIRRRAEDGSRRDGSSTGEGRADILSVRPYDAGVEVSIDARAARDLGRMLPARLSFDRSYRVDGPDLSVAFVPEGRPTKSGERQCVIELSATQVDALAVRLGAKRGLIDGPELAGVRLRVEALEIRDAAGALVQIIG